MIFSLVLIRFENSQPKHVDEDSLVSFTETKLESLYRTAAKTQNHLRSLNFDRRNYKNSSVSSYLDEIEKAKKEKLLQAIT